MVCFHSVHADDSLPPLFINPDNTITDVSTGLMWYQENNPEKIDWDNALSICASLSVSSYTNWRLPSSDELINLFHKMDADSNAIFFPTAFSGQFWTSDNSQGLSANSGSNNITIVTIDTEKGLTIAFANETHYYRAVRDSNYEESFIKIPRRGNAYEIGSLLNIRWDTDSYINAVDIELSRDSGLTYEPLFSNKYSSPLDWLITQPASTNCQLRIIKKDDSISNKIHTVGHFSIVDQNAPILSNFFHRSTLPGKQSDVIEYTIDNTDGGYVMIIARSSNQEVIPLENINLSSRDPVYTKVIPADQLNQSHYFTIQATDKLGQSTITLDIYDSGLLTDQKKFNFIVSDSKDVLIHLYEQTSGTAWRNNTHWNTNVDVCEWEGILCDQDQHVIEINLPNNQLSGSIPVDLGNLSYLTHLNLSNNSLYGEIPENLYLLSNLIELNLSHNSFSGPVPEILANFSQLQKLSIASNLFEGNMPENIQSLSSLFVNQSDFRYNLLTAANPYIDDFISEKQIENEWKTSQTLPPTDLKLLTATNNMISLSWEPTAYTAEGGGYEICCNRSDGTIKCETTNSKSVSTYELWGVLPISNYECHIRTITLPNIHNSNRLVSPFSDSITVVTQEAEDIWNIMESPTQQWLNDIWGMPSSRQYIVGDNGVILVYSNAQWKEMTSNTTQNLHSIYGLSENDIVAVGAEGLVLQYNGSQWKTQDPVVNTFLWDIWGTDSNYYAVGAYGTVIERKNGIWQSINISIDYDLMSIWAASNDDIFVVGQYGTILHFNGNAWVGMNSNTQEDLFAVWGFSENNVFAAGMNGTILNYNGTEWRVMNCPVETHLMDMWGSSTNNFYAVGVQGSILLYDGSQWKKIYSGTANDLRGVWGASELYTVGYNGTILQFATQIPKISSILDQKTNVNIPIKVKFTVGSASISPERLKVKAHPLDQRLIPNDFEHLALYGEGNLRELIITPARDQFGESLIVVTVTSPEGLTSSTSFTLNVSSDPLIPITEREALLALFDQTNGYQWNISDGWTDKWGSECNWYGITCVADRTHVEQIILPNNALSGPIPLTLANLTYLTDLDLHGNLLTGELPGRMGNLRTLIEIDLSNNQIEGNLPEEWGNLGALLYLKLDHNKLEGNIPSAYGNITDLQAIQLNSNRLSGSIPNEITRLFFMKENQSNFDYNALYSTNQSVSSFMERIQTNWDAYQSSIPESVSLTWTAYVITLNWKADTEHTFEVFYSEEPDDNYLKIGSLSDPYCKIRGLIPETTYYIKIRKVRESHVYNANTVYSDYYKLSATTASLDTDSSLWENGNFDQADFYPWEIQDISTSVFFDVIASKTWTEPEFSQFFDITPSARNYVAVHAGMESLGTVKLSQSIYIPAGGGIVSFDYRMGWQMSPDATLDRTFNVTITPENNYTPTEIQTIVSTSSIKEMRDTGWQHMTMDVSSYACQTVNISFELDYPEAVASPMIFVLDNVKLTANYVNILEIKLPESLQEGSAILTDAGQIKLPKAVNQSMSLHVVSSNDLVMLPDQVLIPSGEKIVKFNIIVGDDTIVNGPRQVTVSLDSPEWSACDKQILLLDNDDRWKQIDNINSKYDLKRIWGRSQNDIFMLSDTQIIHFNGTSLEVQYTQTNGYLNNIWGDNDNLFVVGDEGTLLSFENNQWVSAYTSINGNLTGIWGNGKTFFAAGPNGVLLEKTGDEWISQNTIISGIMPVYFGGYEERMYMISESSAYEYTNGDWIPLSGLNDMPLMTDINGSEHICPVLIGKNNSIHYKSNKDWNKIQIDLSTQLNASIGKNNAMYVVGDNGTILRSDASADALTFYKMTSTTEEKLNDVWALSENNVFAVGDNGTFLQYSGPDILGFQDASSFVPGEILSVQNNISFPANVSALTLSVSLPERLTFKDWNDKHSFVEYENHTLFFIWSNQLESPIQFDYRLNVPEYIEDFISISAKMTYIIDNETLEKEMSPSILTLEKSINKYTLYIEVSPENLGNVSGSGIICSQRCRKEFTSSDVIQLQASPESHYNFVKWTDNMNQLISSESSLSLTITQDQTIHAIFRPNEAPLKPVVNYPQNWKIFDTQSIYFELKAFNDPENDPHQKTQWMIHRADRPHTCLGMFSSNCIQSSSAHLTKYSHDDLIPGMQYVWEVACSDTGSEIMVHSDLNRFTIGERAKSNPIEISPGLKEQDYQMISIPMWLENASAPLAFKDAMPSGYDTRYIKIGVFDPTVGAYVQYDDSMFLFPGMAFWILSRNGMEIPVQGVNVTSLEDIDIPLVYSDDYRNGWNMIGSPTKMHYNWNQLLVVVYDYNGEVITERRTIAQLGSDNPYINTHIWRWNNGDYEENDASGIIEPYRGYWVEAKQSNVWLRFSVDAQADMRKRSMDQWGEATGNIPPEPMQGFQEMGDISNGCFISIIGN